MKRMVLGAIVLALVVLACGRRAEPAGGRGGGPDEPTETPVDRVDDRAVNIYATVIREMAGTEDFFEQLYVQDRPCSDAGDAAAPAEPSPSCGAPLTLEEQQAILAALDDLPPTEFVSDPQPIQDRIFQATGAATGSTGLIRFGPIQGDGDRVEVAASSYCGGLCGHWMTLVVERSAGDWQVTGTTGPVAIS